MATHESSTFSCTVAMSENNAESALGNVESLNASVIVQAGNDTRTLISGELDYGNFDYDARQITLGGRCKSAKLHDKKSSEKWLNKKPDEIIKDLAQRAGLSADIASGGKLKAGREWNKDWAKLTDGASYSSVIHKLCEMQGWRWWVDSDGKLHVNDKSSSQGTYSIYYQNPHGGPAQSDTIGLAVHKNYQAAKDIKVKVKTYNQLKKKSYTGEKTVSGKGGSLDYGYEIAGHDQDHVDRIAKSKAAEHARHRYRIVFSNCVGDPSCVAGMSLNFTGDTPFSGTYDIDSVNHQFGIGGYYMTIETRGAGDSGDGGDGGDQ